jgi:hypothetical protein
MNDRADEQRWLHIVTTLVPRSPALPLTFAKGAEARWVSATSLPKIPDSRTNSASVEVLERLSATMVVICWADATAGRYGEQTWTLRVARRCIGRTCGSVASTRRFSRLPQLPSSVSNAANRCADPANNPALSIPPSNPLSNPSRTCFSPFRHLAEIAD